MTDDFGQEGKKEGQRLKYPIDEYIFIKNDIESIAFVSDAANKLTGPVGDTAKVFCSNLIAVYAIASALWVFARNTAWRAVYLTMYGVALGVDRAVDRVFGREEDPEKAKKIHESVQNDLTKSEWGEKRDEVARRLADENLDDFLDHETARDAAAHLLRQCTVLTWSAFEVLTSDLFVYLINTNPRLSALLFRDERTKKLYQAKELIVALEEYGYDLSRNMGEVLLRQSRMDDLVTIRVTFDVLLRGE